MEKRFNSSLDEIYGTVINKYVASGLLIRSIKVNGAYLLCDEINFNQNFIQSSGYIYYDVDDFSDILPYKH